MEKCFFKNCISVCISVPFKIAFQSLIF